MDYLETIDDPLKYYFKEKIGSLYVNKDVMKLFTGKDNMEVEKEVEVLTNLFMRFSEIRDLKTNPNTKPSRMIDRPSFIKRIVAQTDNYEKKEIKKKVDAMMVDKVHTFFEKNNEANKFGTKFTQFVDNDSLVRDKLELQNSVIQSKIFARKQKSMIKGRLNRTIKVFRR